MSSRRRTAVSGLAVLALAGSLVVAGSIVARADAVVNVTSPAEGATLTWSSTTPVTISGTTTATDFYYETINVSDMSFGSPDPMCAGIDPSSGTWECEFPLTPGAKEILVEQYTSGGNFDTVAFTLLPPAPSVDAAVYDVPYGSPLLLEGDAEWNSGTVSATVDGEPVSCDDAPAFTGEWGCVLDFSAGPTPTGTYTVHVQQDAGDGTLSAVVDVTVNIGAPPPAEVVIDYPGNGQDVVWDAPVLLASGRAPLGFAVDLVLDGAPVLGCQGLAVDYNGAWSCSFPVDIGPHVLEATQNGITDSAAFDLLAPAPEVHGLPLSGVVDEPAYSVGGTYAFTGYVVHVRIDVGSGTIECTDAPPFVAGAWSCDLDLTEAPIGSYTLEVWHEPEIPDPTIEWETKSHPITLGYPEAPNLSCAYAPNGGFAASSPWYLQEFSVYRVYVDSGSGSSGFRFPGACNGNSGTPQPESLDVDFELVQDCDQACSLPSLDPGLYELFYRVDGDEETSPSFSQHSYLFTIPNAPTITQTASTDTSVILRGAASAGDLVRVVRPNGSTMCSTTANGAGTWACQFPKSATTSARAIATDSASGGMSAYSAARAIPIATGPVPESTVPLAFVLNWFVEFGGDLMTLKPGDRFTITVDGMPEGTEIEVWMHSTPRLIGSATSAGGQTAIDLVVPMDIEDGSHEIELIALTPGGETYTVTSEAHVTVPAKALDEEGRDDDDGGAPTEGDAVTGDRGDASTPSYITGSLPTVGFIFANPAAIAVAIGLALALLFLVALPAELLNNSLASNTSRLGRTYAAIDRAFTAAQDWIIRVTGSRAVAAALIVTVVAVVWGFVDPRFGFDLVSLRLVLSLALAFFLLTYGTAWLSGVVLRRAWGVTNTVVMQPSIVLFAIIGVVVARLLEFSPGFLIGIGIGLELIAASKRVAARAVLVQFGFVVGFSIAAWIAYSLFVPGEDFVGLLLSDTLASIVAEGLMGAVVAVFPLRFLEGRKVWEGSKRAWAAAFLVVATAFALLVLPTASSATDVSDYGVWIAVFAGFGILAVAAWFFFARADSKEERATEATGEKVDA